MGLMVVSLAFAFVLGFSAHRAGICTVAAVKEVMTAKTARQFAGFLKVVLWVLLINALVLWWWPDLARAGIQYRLSPLVFAGGFMLGVGAAVNGGCSFSTISRIAQGEVHVALTLPAFVAGAYIFARFSSGFNVFHVVGEQTGPVVLHDYMVVALLLWACYELARILGPFVTGKISYRSFLAGRYRLSSGAALIGICSGLLYLMHGRWAYSSSILDYFVPSDSGAAPDGAVAAALFPALLSGAIVSAVSNRQLNFSFARDKWYRNITGGLLMGAGAVMIPGGNGKLILHDLPGLSVAAFFAYLSMTGGITVTLVLYRRMYGSIGTVSCGGDLCKVGDVAGK